jgi:hypothetical protein
MYEENDIFGPVKNDETVEPKPKKAVPRKRTAKKKTAKKKAPPKPVIPDLPVDKEPPEEEPSEETPDGMTRVASSIDRSAVSVGKESNVADTLPKLESPLEKAKRERPEVARWDKFLGSLKRGTVEMIYEMGISGIEEGDRPLVSFSPSDLSRGPMLQQHVDDIQVALGKMDLTLKKPPSGAGVLNVGDAIPELGISKAERKRRIERRKKLRTTR